MSKVTTHDIRRMREMAAAGHTATDIAAALGVVLSTVRYWSRHSGITIVPQRKPVDQAAAHQVGDLAEQGLCARQIAHRLGVSPTRVRRTARRFGVPLPAGVTGRPLSAEAGAI